MKKLKEIYDSFSKLIENPRARSIIILSMYTIFFVIIILMINVGKSIDGVNLKNGNQKIEKELNYKNVITQYEYQSNIEITENDVLTKYQISGNSSDENQVVKIYDNEKEEFVLTSKPIIINNKFFDLKEIIGYVNNLEYEFSTTYKDGTILKNYLVPIKNIDNNFNTNEKFEINVYDLKGNITKLIINSTNYDRLKNNKITKIIYEIKYNNSVNVNQ